jgi:hypothetical protein
MAFASDTLNIAQNSATDSSTRVQREQGKRPLSGVITAMRSRATHPGLSCCNPHHIHQKEHSGIDFDLHLAAEQNHNSCIPSWS